MMHHCLIVLKYYQMINIISKVCLCNKYILCKYFFSVALFRRASCYLAKQQYEEAKHDLDILLTVDQENAEAQVR